MLITYEEEEKKKMWLCAAAGIEIVTIVRCEVSKKKEEGKKLMEGHFQPMKLHKRTKARGREVAFYSYVRLEDGRRTDGSKTEKGTGDDEK